MDLILSTHNSEMVIAILAIFELAYNHSFGFVFEQVTFPNPF